MSNEPEMKEGWMIFGGDRYSPGLAVPVSLGIQILQNHLSIRVHEGGRGEVSVDDLPIPVTVMTADAVTTIRVKQKMLGTVRNEVAVKMEMAKMAMEQKMERKMEVMKAPLDTSSLLADDSAYQAIKKKYGPTK